MWRASLERMEWVGVSEWAVRSNDVLLWVNTSRFVLLVRNVCMFWGSYFDRDGCWRHRSVLGNVGPLHRRSGSCSSHVLKHKGKTNFNIHTQKKNPATPYTDKYNTHTCDIIYQKPERLLWTSLQLSLKPLERELAVLSASFGGR